MFANRLRAPVALALACSFACAHAQVAIDGAVQNFDSLASAGTSSALPPGWSLIEVGGGGAANGSYTAGTGSGNAGDAYSFGAALSSERALGSLASGSVQATIGAQLINATGAPLTQFEIAFTTEQWRLGTTGGADRLTFSYSTNATSLADGTWTPVPTFDVVAPVTNGTSGTALDGNDPANRTAVAGTLAGLALAADATLWVRWVDIDDGGSDDGIAIDDIRFGSAIDVPPAVASTAPADGASNVALDAPITITFTEAVDAIDGWFALDCGVGTPALIASGGPAIYTLSHAAPLPSGANCTLSVESDFVTDLDGMPDGMAVDFSASFGTVVDLAPTIVSTIPVDGATDVSRAANLGVAFSEPVTPLADAFTLECPGGVPVAFTVDTDDDTAFVIDPSVTLPPSTQCIFTVDATKFTDQDGVPQAPALGAAIDFQTAGVTAPVLLSSVPTDEADNFPSAGDVVIVFDQPVTLAVDAFALSCAQSMGIVLGYANAGTQFEVNTGTALVAGDVCSFTIEADAVTSDDGLHPAGDIVIDFTVVASGPGNYYAQVNTSSPGQLRCTLHQAIDGHTSYPYTSGSTDTWDILEIADEDPTNPNNVLDVYKNASYAKAGGGNANYDREHTWPKSLGFPNENAAYTDTHMLHVSYSNYNSARGNSPYDNCPGCSEKPTEVNNGVGGGIGVYPGNSNWNTGSVFEVWNHRKGDMARSVMYMAIRYEGGDGIPDLELTSNLGLVQQADSSDAIAYMGKLSTLIAWHLQDPPDNDEILRNEVVFGFQGNRNPFIDHPEWGTESLFTSVTPNVCEPVMGGNTAPIANDDSYNASEDTPLVVAAAGVLANDTDAQMQALTAVLVANVQHGMLSLAANGGFTYTPAANYCGADGFSYQANDGTLNSATAFVTLEVGCANDAPAANDATFSLPENSEPGTPVGQVTATDVDGGQVLSYAITAGNAAGAFAIDGGNGTIRVADAAPLDFEVASQFVLTVTVTDNGDPAADDTATITIDLTDVDEGAAAANDDIATVDEDSGANVLNVLANDTVDPDTGSIAVTGVSTALHGSTSFTAGDVTYTPAANYCGPDSFTYTVSGGDTATVSVTVTCIDDPLLIFADGFED